MKVKVNWIVVCILILSLSFVNLVSAEILVSDSGVQYDSRILEEFSKLNGTDNAFVSVIIHLKDSVEADNLVVDFSNNELKDVINHQIPNKSVNRISAKISEEGFFKLIQDDRVEKIYHNGVTQIFLDENRTNSLVVLIEIFIGIILIVLLLYLIIKKRKKM